MSAPGPAPNPAARADAAPPPRAGATERGGATERDGRPVIALDPLATPGNGFCELFAAALAPRPVEALDWDRAVRGHYDAAVLHWPTAFFRPSRRAWTALALLRMARARVRGTRFVWVVHNLRPHDGGGAESALTRTAFLWLLSGIVHLSEFSRGALRREYRLAPWTREAVTVHGAYPGKAAPPREPGGPTRLLLFGHVRRYKNIPHLVSLVRAVPELSLVVAGRVWDDALAREIRDAAGDDPRIRLDLRDAPLGDDEIERVIADCDVVALPYGEGGGSVLNSGVAFHALSRGRRVLAPAIGALPELSRAVGPGWMHVFEPPLTEQALRAFSATPPPAGQPDLSRHGWDRVGRDVGGFLDELTASRRPEAARARLVPS